MRRLESARAGGPDRLQHRCRLQVNVKNAGSTQYFESSPLSLYPQAGRQLVLALHQQF